MYKGLSGLKAPRIKHSLKRLCQERSKWRRSLGLETGVKVFMYRCTLNTLLNFHFALH